MPDVTLVVVDEGDPPPPTPEQREAYVAACRKLAADLDADLADAIRPGADRGAWRTILSDPRAPAPRQSLLSPVGLRGLFPTNLVRVRVRRTDQPKESDMTARKDEPARGANQPRNAPDEDRDAIPRGQVRGGATGPQEPAKAILPQGVTTEPGPQEAADADAGGPGTADLADPGPPPTRPAYSGPYSPTVDVLFMAAEARDKDALRAVRTVNEPPEVAQLKANLLEWIDTDEAHRIAAVRGDPNDRTA